MADGHRSLLGRNLFPALGLSIQQANNPQTVNQVDQEYCPNEKQIATNFPDLLSRVVKSKVHTVRSKFHRICTPSHQKGCRVPINLLDKVSEKIKKSQNKDTSKNYRNALIRTLFLQL